MTYTLSRRVVLGVYAVLVIVPLVVVIFGSFKTSQALFASPFTPPTDWQGGNSSKGSSDSGLGAACRNLPHGGDTPAMDLVAHRHQVKGREQQREARRHDQQRP